MSDEKPKTKYDAWSPEQRKVADEYLKEATAALNYKQAGNMAADPNGQQYYHSIMKNGGLAPEMATDIARYRMWKMGMRVPEGPRASADTPDQITARGQRLLSGDPALKAQALAEQQQIDANSHQEFFDGLANPHVNLADDPPPASIALPPDAPPPAIAAAPPPQEEQPPPGPMLAMGASDRRAKKNVTSGNAAAQDFLSRVAARGAWPKGVS